MELVGGGHRKGLIEGMNSGAKSYVADLWNMTCNEPGDILRAHKNIEKATDLRLAYINEGGDRIRTNPGSSTRLMVAPRPLHLIDTAMGGPSSTLPASFVDLAILACFSAVKQVGRQGGVYLYLHQVRGQEEARLWADLFAFVEQHLDLPQGAFRATVIMDTLAAVLDAEGILYELRHHSAGLSLDPQAYAADHILLFSKPDSPLLPDREQIGFNATFLRSVSLRTISICHRRQAHALGAPAFVLPPGSHGPMKPRYLEMIADKEREAVDGHDGTLVGHPGLVNPAMAEFNKSMPKAHQLYYRPEDRSTPADLVATPEGELTIEGLQGCIRTVLRAMVQFRHQGMIIQGGRLHDRSSIRLSTLLLWHWGQHNACVITGTGLDINEAVMRYLIKKEGEKLFATEDDPQLQERAQLAAQRLAQAVLLSEPPPDLMVQEPILAPRE